MIFQFLEVETPKTFTVDVSYKHSIEICNRVNVNPKRNRKLASLKGIRIVGQLQLSIIIRSKT